MANIHLYSVAMTEAIAKGDVAEMKKVKAQAEEYVKKHGDIASLLQHLKVEIARAEAGTA